MTKYKQTSLLSVSDHEQVLAFRLDSHSLARRMPSDSLLEVAAACGLQNTPPGSAMLALHARLSNLVLDDVDRALSHHKTLLQVLSLRAAPYIVPTHDAEIFTLGVLPDDEASRRFFVFGAARALDQIGISATELVQYTAAALPDVLDNRELTKDNLGIELAQRLEKQLTSQQLQSWHMPSWYAPDQRLGESVVRFALSIVALQGLFCLAPRRGNSATYIRTDQWLGTPPSNVRRDDPRAELVRRYLHCYSRTSHGFCRSQRPRVSGFYRRTTHISHYATGKRLFRIRGGVVAFGGQPSIQALCSPMGDSSRYGDPRRQASG